MNGDQIKFSCSFTDGELEYESTILTDIIRTRVRELEVWFKWIGIDSARTKL